MHQKIDNLNFTASKSKEIKPEQFYGQSGKRKYGQGYEPSPKFQKQQKDPVDRLLTTKPDNHLSSEGPGAQVRGIDLPHNDEDMPGANAIATR